MVIHDSDTTTVHEFMNLLVVTCQLFSVIIQDSSVINTGSCFYYCLSTIRFHFNFQLVQLPRQQPQQLQLQVYIVVHLYKLRKVHGIKVPTNICKQTDTH